MGFAYNRNARPVHHSNQEKFFGYQLMQALAVLWMPRPKISPEVDERRAKFYEVLNDEMEKTYVSTWSWLNHKFGDDSNNLLAFSSEL